MSRKKLEQYKGMLTAEKATEGMNCALKNARRLISDAKLLYDAGRYPSSTALAILAIEEAGKVGILRGVALCRSESELKMFWRDYRTHTSKNRLWRFPELVTKGANKIDDFSQLFNESSEHSFILDNLKQVSFYTDCLGDAHWSLPENVVEKDLAEQFIKIAEIVTPKDDVTIREIELWIENMGPVWNVSFEGMKKALVKWFDDMQKEGIYPEGQNDMIAFVTSGLKHEKKKKH